MTQARGEGRTGAEPAGPPDDVADAPNVRRLPVAPVELPPGRRTAERAPTGAAELAAIAEEVGLRRVRFVAWRDLDDPEAGGSEVHAHRVATLWAEAGIDVAFRTSAVAGGSRAVGRDGYRVTRRAGRYAVFPAAAAEGLAAGRRSGEGLVEVWNGMPFFSPLWYRGPRIAFLHHVHAEMWRMVLPDWLARVGEAVERRVAPPLYRRTRVVTLSQSSKDEIVSMLALPAQRVTVAPPGVEPRFRPGGSRSPVPLVVAVGRLVPVKRFDLLIEALVRARRHVPDLEAVIVGEGYERPHLEALRRRHRAEGWLSLPGRATDDEVLDWYRRAWVVASTSQREGWGMTLTEAGACGTPSVATDIAGHRDAVLDGRTGLLVDGADGVAAAITEVVGDAALRARLGRGALERSRWFTWQATARTTLEALASECRRRG
ncbi:MAG: glycosyltransferase family 4 protein [Acidimicrobiales bacterium]